MNIRNMTEQQHEDYLKESLINSLNTSLIFIQNEILKPKNEETISNVKRNIDHISQIINLEEFNNLVSNISNYENIITIGQNYIES